MSTEPRHPSSLDPNQIPGIAIGTLGGWLAGFAFRGPHEPKFHSVLKELRGHTVRVIGQLEPITTDIAAAQSTPTTPLLDLRIPDASAGRSGAVLLALEQRYLLAVALVASHGPWQGPEVTQLQELLDDARARKRSLSEGLAEVSKVVGDLEVVQASIGCLKLKLRPRRPKHRDDSGEQGCISAGWAQVLIGALSIAATLYGPVVPPNGGQTPVDDCVIVFEHHDSDGRTRIELPCLAVDDVPKSAKKGLSASPAGIDVKIVSGRDTD